MAIPSFLALCVHNMVKQSPLPQILLEEQDSTGDQNLCIDGHLAPEFMLIGAQKAGTTSFFSMLRHPSIILPKEVADDPTTDTKSLHIFDHDERFQLGPKFWLAHYPECTHERRLVAADFTPNYLWADPEHIKQFYGEKAGQIKFAVILRNPVSRIQSAFHYFNEGERNGGKCLNDSPKGFKAYVEGMLNGDDPCTFLKRSNYTKYLERYLEIFSPSQFVVIPYLQVVDPKDGRSMAAVAVWETLGLSGEVPQIEHRNPSTHESLIDELGPDLLERFQSHVSRTMGVNQLAELMCKHRINVFGYGGVEIQEGVAAFLANSW